MARESAQRRAKQDQPIDDTGLFRDIDIMEDAPFEPKEAATLILASAFQPLKETGHIFTENDGTPIPY